MKIITEVEEAARASDRSLLQVAQYLRDRDEALGPVGEYHTEDERLRSARDIIALATLPSTGPSAGVLQSWLGDIATACGLIPVDGDAKTREARRILHGVHFELMQAAFPLPHDREGVPTTPTQPLMSDSQGDAPDFQTRDCAWVLACFGDEVSSDVLERCDRFIEEACELVQALDYPAERIAALTKYTYDKPKGEPFQEAGGVMMTMGALCGAVGLNMHEAGEAELARCWTKVDAIRAKQAAKPVGSALPIAPTQPPASDSQGGEDTDHRPLSEVVADAKALRDRLAERLNGPRACDSEEGRFVDTFVWDSDAMVIDELIEALAADLSALRGGTLSDRGDETR